MPRHAVVIGVGGTGKRALTMLKERLWETYGEVPDRVILLSLDTDDLREDDVFAGVRLNPNTDERRRSPEYRTVTTTGGVTLDTVFADIKGGRTASYMDWLEYNKLDRILSPAERDIRGGAQQRRPIGRVALFLQYRNVYSHIRQAIAQMYADVSERQAEQLEASTITEQGKRVVFVVGSVAGGTGSGMFIDVANLVRNAINSNRVWQSASVSGVIVLPDAFSSFISFMDDPTNLKPNSFAALRELDRFMRAHSTQLPYMTRYDQPDNSITWNVNQPLDHVYLVDTSSASGGKDFDLTGNPDFGVFPVISDFIMAHIDSGLGDQLATLRSNAGQHYRRAQGNLYSSFNVRSYIFPVRDIIRSFSYRFLREMLHNYYLPVRDESVASRIENDAKREIETVFSIAEVAGEANPPFLQELISHTRTHEPEPLRTAWEQLLISISPSAETQKNASEQLRGSLDDLESILIPTDEKEGETSFKRGRERLMDTGTEFDDRYLGLKRDPHREESRADGEWDRLLEPMVEAQRQYFVRVLDAYLLSVLNRRDERGILIPARLAHADAILRQLQSRVKLYRSKIVDTWRSQNQDDKRRKVDKELQEYTDWMLQTQDAGFLDRMRRVPQQAQKAYIDARLEKAELDLAYRLYQLSLRICDILAGERRDEQGRLSVIETAWVCIREAGDTMAAVEQLLSEQSRQHERARSEKRSIRVREYVTNAEFEDSLYRQPDIRGRIAQAILGQRGEERGLFWERRNQDIALAYHLTTSWSSSAQQAREIATAWQQGSERLYTSLLRSREMVASRLRNYFGNPAMFVNESDRVQEPYLRYNPAENGLQLNRERFISVRTQGAPPESADFFVEAGRALDNMDFNYSTNGESDIACTVILISRGVRLAAVAQYTSLGGDYRSKLSQGWESIHLFPEEQRASDLERQIPSLGLREQSVRTFQPEVAITLGNMSKVQTFTLASAYGLIKSEDWPDPETGRRTTELVLDLDDKGKYRLTNSERLRGVDTLFASAPDEAQFGWLLLDALQSFALRWTKKNGIPAETIPTIESELGRLGVQLRKEDKVDQPFTLDIFDVNQAIDARIDSLALVNENTPDHQRPPKGAKQYQQIRILDAFINDIVARMEMSEAPKVRDLGVVMHLILKAESERLRGQARRTR